MNGRAQRLSNSPGPAGRFFGAVVGAVFVAGGLLFAVMAIGGERFVGGDGDTGQCVASGDLAGMPADALPPDVAVCSEWLPPHIGVLGWFGLVIGGGLALLGLYVAARWLRAAAWLDGTTLRVRGALRTRVVDLAVAEVTLGTVTHTHDNRRSHRVPVLLARYPAGGSNVKLPLNAAGTDLLPPSELRALADAVTANRPSSQAQAGQVAAQLRQMADNPLNLPAP